MTREEAAKQLSEWKEVITIPSRKEAIDMAIKVLEQEPSNGDLIWRNDAVDALAYFDERSPTGKTAQDIIIGLPSAEPEIIHCKECKYGVQDEDEWWYCRGFGCQVGDEDGSGFCADAERRTDE